MTAPEADEDGLADRLGSQLARHSRVVIAVVLLATVVIGAGAVVGEFDSAGIGEFEVDDPATDAQEVIRADYGGDDRVRTQIAARPAGNALARAALVRGLDLQLELLADETVAPTLTEERPVYGAENVIATAAVARDRADAGGPSVEADPPTRAEQRAALASRTDAEVAALVEAVVAPGSATSERLQPFLPRSWTPGTATVDARLTVVTHADAGSDATLDAQVRIDERVETLLPDGFAFGQGVTDAASSSAIGDSFTVITPVALVVTLLLLGVAYRDPIDILIALVGIGLVLVWLAGIIGWLGLPTSQLIIAVPFLLIGLSIDYGLHIVMRYREARAGTLEGRAAVGSPRAAVGVAIGSVLLALAAATFSTGVGFLSNVVSPLPAVQTFAILAGAGIFATFAVFATFVPALKAEVDERLDRTGSTAALGVEAGAFNRLLAALAGLARRWPAVVVAVAILLAAVAGAGATGLDTTFNQADFLPQDAPDWAKSLPGPLAAGTYTVSDDAEYLAATFVERGNRGQASILVTGDVRDPELLRAMETLPAGDGAIAVLGDGAPSVQSPATAIRTAAAADPDVAATVDAHDDDGDGLPDRGVGDVYDALFAAEADAAAAVLHRDGDGTYTSARIQVDVRGDVADQAVASDVKTLAAHLEAAAPVEATATGDRVVSAAVQDALLETLVQAFAVTLVVILLALLVGARLRYGSASLGVIIIVPVLVALAWLLGGMALLDIPLNSETAVIASLAIGLGVDYSIHLGDRIATERRRAASIEAALTRAMTGTGGALLGSAVTTATGFGVLALALVPSLQRFGIVTATSIALAYVACLTVLPSLFVLRERLRDRLRR